MDWEIATARDANAQESFLSKLPGDIRSTICRLVLVSDGPVAVKPWNIPCQRALLKTCHQVREKVIDRIYRDWYRGK